MMDEGMKEAEPASWRASRSSVVRASVVRAFRINASF
jgi:hypothetical protein